MNNGWITPDFPEWLLQGYLGEDDEDEPIIYDADSTYWHVGYDDEGNPIVIEIP